MSECSDHALGLSPAVDHGSEAFPRSPSEASEKQVIQVLNAVRSGAETSTEIEALTGLSLKKCSAYLTALFQEGMIVRIGEVRFPGCSRVSYRYAIVQEHAPMPQAIPRLSHADGRVAFHVDASVTSEEMSRWQPERINRYFHGIAQILEAAKGY